jgi:hypothetical protein
MYKSKRHPIDHAHVPDLADLVGGHLIDDMQVVNLVLARTQLVDHSKVPCRETLSDDGCPTLAARHTSLSKDGVDGYREFRAALDVMRELTQP